MTLYLEVGKFDLIAGKSNEKFHKRLEKAGIPHTYVVTPAGFPANQVYIHGEGFLRDNMDKSMVLFSQEIAEPVKIVSEGFPV